MPRKKTFKLGKEVRKLARERVGTVPSARLMDQPPKPRKPKHKKPVGAEDDV